MGVGFAHGQKPQGAMAKAAKLRNLLKLKLLFRQVMGRSIEVVSSFSGAFGRSENPMAGTAVLPCASHDCWLDNCSPTKLTNSHMNHNTFKPSILLRTTLNTWRLTPHVSRWNIEKVLEIALCLIPLYPKPKIPWLLLKSSHPVASSHPQRASTRRPSSPLHGIFARQGQGMQNHQPRKLLRGPCLQGLGRGWEDGRQRRTWRGETIKTVQNQYRKVAHLETVVIFRCCLCNFIRHLVI